MYSHGYAQSMQMLLSMVTKTAKCYGGAQVHTSAVFTLSVRSDPSFRCHLSPVATRSVLAVILEVDKKCSA